MKVPLILIFGVLVQLVTLVCALHPADTGLCGLEASELGPDWYKVPQPIPTEFHGMADYVRTYVHMPCAATTVFDVAICGCTNLMSFLYSTLDDRSHGDATTPSIVTVRPGDWVKTISPKTPPRPSVSGSILLNTQTGEIRQCPFRASSRGPGWYLMHEPNDVWRPMQCAPGTMFYKKHCTCVHSGVYLSEENKSKDSDIVVLEDDFNSNTGQTNTISKALGISVSDIDFRSNPKSNVPLWRRESANDNVKQTSDPNKGPRRVKSDVKVTSFNGDPFVDNVTLPLGKDAISHQHKLRLLRKGPIPFIQKDVSPLTIDSKVDSNVRKVNVVKLETNADLVELDKVIEKMRMDKQSNETKDRAGSSPTNEVIIFAHKECSKRPIPELGPQFFQLYIWGFGLVPYICNGDRVYDDTKCACVIAPRNASYDEVHFPVTDCHKRAAPELGPRYFQMYQWGYGFTPYRCHQDLVFNHQHCACVKP